jgi:hypothetical protein
MNPARPASASLFPCRSRTSDIALADMPSNMASYLLYKVHIAVSNYNVISTRGQAQTIHQFNVVACRKARFGMWSLVTVVPVVYWLKPYWLKPLNGLHCRLFNNLPFIFWDRTLMMDEASEDECYCEVSTLQTLLDESHGSSSNNLQCCGMCCVPLKCRVNRTDCGRKHLCPVNHVGHTVAQCPRKHVFCQSTASILKCTVHAGERRSHRMKMKRVKQAERKQIKQVKTHVIITHYLLL